MSDRWREEAGPIPGLRELWARMRQREQVTHQTIESSGHILDLAHELIASSDKRLTLSRLIHSEYLHGKGGNGPPSV